METEVEPKAIESVEKKMALMDTLFQPLVDRAKAAVLTLRVETAEHYRNAMDLLRVIAANRKKEWDYLDEDIRDANRLHKSLTTKRAERVKPWDLLRDKVEAEARRWRLAEDSRVEKARLEQERVNQQSTKKAEVEAAELMSQGFVKEAKAVQATAQILSEFPLIEAPQSKAEGVSSPEKWVGICDQLLPLLKAAAEGKVDLYHMVKVRGGEEEQPLFYVNERVLNMMADRQQKEFNWPGCHAEKDLTFRVRG